MNKGRVVGGGKMERVTLRYMNDLNDVDYVDYISYEHYLHSFVQINTFTSCRRCVIIYVSDRHIFYVTEREVKV